jgi:hypothetical protein
MINFELRPLYPWMGVTQNQYVRHIEDKILNLIENRTPTPSDSRYTDWAIVASLSRLTEIMDEAIWQLCVCFLET